MKSCPAVERWSKNLLVNGGKKEVVGTTRLGTKVCVATVVCVCVHVCVTPVRDVFVDGSKNRTFAVLPIWCPLIFSCLTL